MKIAIVGAGGIGSYFCRNLSETFKKDIKGIVEIDPFLVTVFDADNVEEKNLLYANFDIDDLSLNKAECMKNKYHFNCINRNFEDSDIQNYDLIILCVDNNDIRLIVSSHKADFIDLRATGRAIFGYISINGLNDKEYKKYTLEQKGVKGSCQYQKDIDSKTIRFGNRVIAEVGLQLLQDYMLDSQSGKLINFHI